MACTLHAPLGKDFHVGLHNIHVDFVEWSLWILGLGS
jgi:hypothetical protein